MSDAGSDDETGEATDAGRREVVVPPRLYKTVTVFSTLIAIVFVVLGFTFLDAATLRPESILFLLVNSIPVDVPVPVDDGTLSALLALTGLACIVAGSSVYVLGTRFRTEGMRKDKDEPDEGSGNG